MRTTAVCLKLFNPKSYLSAFKCFNLCQSLSMPFLTAAKTDASAEHSVPSKYICPKVMLRHFAVFQL